MRVAGLVLTTVDVVGGAGWLEGTGGGPEEGIEAEGAGGGEEGGKRSNLAALASAWAARRVASRVLKSPIILTNTKPISMGSMVKARCQVM